MKTILLFFWGLIVSLPSSAQVDTSKVYTVVQQMPEFPGGQDSMDRFVSNHIKYPKAAADSGVQGRVVLGYVVNKDGSVSDVQVKRGIHPWLDAEAVRVVSEFPRQKPGMQLGQLVRVQQVVPVTFRIAKVPEFTLPVFPGGEQAMRNYVKSNVRHQDGAHGFLGVVPVGFDVDAAGNIANIRCMVSVPGAVDSEAVRVISTFPRLEPARQMGQPVASQIIIKVVFFDEKLVVDADGFYNGTALEEEPSMPGGERAKNAFFEKYLNKFYVRRDLKKGLEVEFTVGADSTVSDIQVTKGIDARTDAELVKAMTNLHKFNPGVYNGLPVKTRVKYTIDSVKVSSDADSTEHYPALPVFLSLPHFPGGEAAMMNFIQNVIQYPAEDRELDIQGRVLVSFVVDKEGNLTKIKIQRGVSKNIDAEALRVVGMIPDFVPGTLQGKPVKVAYILPISFKLAEAK